MDYVCCFLSRACGPEEEKEQEEASRYKARTFRLVSLDFGSVKGCWSVVLA